MATTNTQYADWAEIAVSAFTAEVYNGRSYPQVRDDEGEDAISDLLCDLMHLCRRDGYDFDSLVDRGRDHFDAEVKEDDLEHTGTAE